MRPAAKPAQVPKGTFPTPLEPVKAPGRVSGEAASTDIPRGAHSAREQRHRLRASSGRPVPRRNPEPDEAIGASRKGFADSRDRAALPPSRTAWPCPPLHKEAPGSRTRFTRPNARSSSHHAPGPGGESRGGGSPPKPDAPRKANPSPRPVSGTRHPRPAKDGGWRPVRCPRRQAGRPSCTDRPRRAPCRTARSEPSGGASRGRPTAGSLRRAPRTEPAAPPAMQGFPKNPSRIRRQNPDRIGSGPPGERPAALRRTGRSPNRSFARERGGRFPGLRLPSARGGPEGLCRDSAKDACSDTFAYRRHGILLLLKRSRRMSVFA